MKKRNRRSVEVSVSFLDVISCGFGAIVLLLLLGLMVYRHYQLDVPFGGPAPTEETVPADSLEEKEEGVR